MSVGFVLLLAPGFLLQIGTTRKHPLDISGAARTPRGTLQTRDREILSIAFGGAPAGPAGGVAVARAIRNQPPGTPVSYRIREGSAQRFVTGRVAQAVEPFTASARRLIQCVVALACIAGAIALIIAGSDRHSALAAATLSGTATLFAFDFVEPNVVLIRDAALRNSAIFLWLLWPRFLGFYYGARFLFTFPIVHPPSRIHRALTGTLGATAIGWSVLSASLQIPGFADRLPIASQVAVISFMESGLSTLLMYALPAAVVILTLIMQRRARSSATSTAAMERRRKVISGALLAGLGIPFAAMVLQALSLILRRKLLFPGITMSLSFLALTLVPAGLTYAVLGRRVETFGVIARRAALLASGRTFFRIASFAPIVVLALLLAAHRDRPLQEIWDQQSTLIALLLSGGVGAFLFSDRIHAFVASRFLGDESVAREILIEIPRRLGTATDRHSAATVLAHEVDRALHLESAVVFLRENDSFRPESRADLPALDVSSPLLQQIESSQAPLPLSQTATSSTETDAQWVRQGPFELAFPLRGSSGGLFGFLATGERTAGGAVTETETQLIAAACIAAGMVVENLALRSTPGSTRTFDVPSAEPPPEECARLCPSCGTVYGPTEASICRFDDTALDPVPIPHILAGKMRIERRIGAGAMGVVYLGRDLLLGRPIAVKTLPRLSSVAAARLRREARATAMLHHPNVATLFAAELWYGTPMLVFEYLEAGTLARRISESRVAPREVQEWGVALSRGLAEAHSKQILHRDVKPSNIGFSTAGVPKLLDFGLARLLDDPLVVRELAADEEMTADHGSSATRLAGTPAYVAPEIVAGASATARSDIWSLGLTLYEALTGLNPFLDLTPTRTLNRILSLTVPHPLSLRPGCPEHLANALLRCLDKNPASRPASAGELEALLHAAGAADGKIGEVQ